MRASCWAPTTPRSGRVGRRAARTQFGCYLARQRSLDSLQRGLRVLRSEKESRKPLTHFARRGKRDSGTPSGRAAIRTLPSCMATLNLSASTQRALLRRPRQIPTSSTGTIGTASARMAAADGTWNWPRHPAGALAEDIHGLIAPVTVKDRHRNRRRQRNRQSCRNWLSLRRATRWFSPAAARNRWKRPRWN